VIGKTASCAAMALTFGAYAAPSLARWLAVAAVVVLVAINYLGVSKTASVTRLLVTLVLASLAVVVAGALFGGEADAARLAPLFDTGGVYGVLQASGIIFFAFAGYARIATLGEEVRDPETVIPRAIPVAFAVTVAVYAVVAGSALAAVGSGTLARSASPLAAAVEAGSLNALTPVVRLGAAIASLGVLLSLLAGVSRTTFAMAAERDLPHRLAAVHPRFKVPHRAELVIGAVVVAVVALADVRGAIGFSSFAVLLYYAIANASALTLSAAERRWPRWISALGLLGCVTLAFALPLAAVLVGAAVVVAGAAGYALGRRRQ
jgi:APA family basic amino acid/polyamine antiporter